jgi:hypothetical protein
VEGHSVPNIWGKPFAKAKLHEVGFGKEVHTVQYAMVALRPIVRSTILVMVIVPENRMPCNEDLLESWRKQMLPFSVRLMTSHMFLAISATLRGESPLPLPPPTLPLPRQYLGLAEET